MADDKQHKETLRIIEAFEYYFKLGATRTLQQVADHFRVNPVTVRRWSTYFKWQERISERDVEIAEEVRSQLNKTLIKSKVNYRNILGAVLNEFIGRLKKAVEDKTELPIKINDVKDLEKIIKMDILLVGNDEDASVLGIDSDKMLSESRYKAMFVLSQLLASPSDQIRLRAAELLLEQQLSGIGGKDTDLLPPDFEGKTVSELLEMAKIYREKIGNLDQPKKKLLLTQNVDGKENR